MQILPEKMKASHPFQFNVMHVLPTNKIPFHKVPLDMIISNKLTFHRKFDKQKKMNMATQTHQPVHSRDQEAEEEGIILLDEFKFPHCAMQINDTEFTAEGLKFVYSKMYSFLKLQKRKHCGVTLILNP